eukprot:TRINITY_DN13061_c0_g1_i1.p1 TRINITY_DN13061_c0_g1~~TRINITY_DN13061_c0_g1_i1.p1  ORF type:complete len:269 (+),score=55.46 TRINITY_DN13061_c0_g1_i1:25-831(+)
MMRRSAYGYALCRLRPTRCLLVSKTNVWNRCSLVTSNSMQTNMLDYSLFNYQSVRMYAPRGGGREIKSKSEKKKGKKGESDEEFDGEEFKENLKTALDTKLQASTERLTTNLATLRVGRVNPEILHKIKLLDGSLLKNHCTIFVKDAKTLGVVPADPKKIVELETAITHADIGSLPKREATTILVPFPKATKEMKDLISKQLAKLIERTKTEMRLARQDSLTTAKGSKGKLPKDEFATFEKELNVVHEEAVKKIEEIQKSKLESLEQS